MAREEWTTLSVPGDFAATLRKDYDGNNDMERLRNWADDVDGIEDVLARLDDLPEETAEEIRAIQR